MSDTTPPAWEAGPIIQWLLDEGRFLTDLDDLVRQLGRRMLAADAPLWRLRLSMRTLHPLTAAVTSVWERDQKPVQHVESPHGLEHRPGHVGSPLEIIGRTGQPFRKRLTGALSTTDHSVLHDLKARGATDYLALPLRYSDSTRAALVYTSDAAEGFSKSDVAQLTTVAQALTPIAEVHSARRIARAVAEAYLGPRTGPRVLEGNITRGDIDTIEAAIMVTDIRDWTGLNTRLPATEALARANRYFEVIADAVKTHDGEILKFLGDGVLAVFPTDDTITADDTCIQALAAARHALHTAATLDPPLELRFGVGLHFGEVLYGNIGSETRIDFTVLGPAVNTAARIEGLCSELDRAILFSDAIATRVAEPAVVVAEKVLKGHSIASEVFTTTGD